MRDPVSNSRVDDAEDDVLEEEEEMEEGGKAAKLCNEFLPHRERVSEESLKSEGDDRK